MRLVKVKKKVYKREFLEYRLIVVVFNISTLTQEEDGTTTVEQNKVYWVYPAHKDSDIDLESPNKITI